MALLLLILFILLILIGLPIAFAMGATTLTSFFALGGNGLIIPLKMFSGVDVFTYLCIPLFILASEIMSSGGIIKKIVEFSNDLVGHITGGLAHVNVLASMFFAGITGSATADAAGLGTIEMELMTEGGYDRKFAAGITAASAIIGPIIPPSGIMIIYAVVAGNISVSKLFLAGIIPGLLMGVGLMITSWVIAKKRGIPKNERRATLKELGISFIKTLPSLLLPVIILGGIISGIFTATEAAAVAVLYAFVVTRFILKSITMKDLYRALVNTAKTTANVMLIISISSAMGWAITALRIPQTVTDFFISYAGSKFVFLLFVNILLIVIGTILDQSPALLIMVPILLPVALQFGIDPLHFGIMVIVNLCIGLITPPVGMTLFVVTNVARIRLSEMYRAILPFLVCEAVVLALVTYIPEITTLIPGLIH